MRTYITKRDTGVGGFVVSGTNPVVLDNGMTVAIDAVVGDLILFGAGANPTDLVNGTPTKVLAADAATFWRKVNVGTFATIRTVRVGGVIETVTDNGSDNYTCELDTDDTVTFDSPSVAPRVADIVSFDGSAANLASGPDIIPYESQDFFNGTNPGPPVIPVPPGGAWDTETASSEELIFTNDDRTVADSTGGTRKFVLADTSNNSGKKYFEVLVHGTNGAAIGTSIGIATNSVNAFLDTLGTDIDSYGYTDNGRTYWDDNQVYLYNGYTGNNNDVIQYCCDFDAGEIRTGVNNVEWNRSGGNPDALFADNPALYSNLTTDDWFPAIMLLNTAGLLTINMTEDDLAFTPPTGYSAWVS